MFVSVAAFRKDFRSFVEELFRVGSHDGGFFFKAQLAKETALSTHIWDLKSENREYEVKWSILKHAKAYTSGEKRCNLYLEEKAAIMRADPKKLFNKRTEIFSKCRHRDKHCLRNYATSSTHSKLST